MKELLELKRDVEEIKNAIDFAIKSGAVDTKNMSAEKLQYAKNMAVLKYLICGGRK